MRGMTRLAKAIVISALVAGCGSNSMTTAPSGGGAGSGGYGAPSGGTGGSGGNTGSQGGSTGGSTGGQGGTTGGQGGTTGGGMRGGGPISSAVTVTVGNDFFRSDRNGSANTAVDTVAAGGTVTWRWGTTAAVPHSVQSVATPSFASSAIQTGSGSTYQVTFTTPGTYHYNCAVHGNLMSGVVVVTP